MRLDFEETLTSDQALNPSKALNLFRITQEAINNAIKHSDGKILTIKITELNGSLQLLIADNGKGVPVERTERNGYGLRNIEFRAKEIGASLSFSSAPAQGTRIKIDLLLTNEIR